MLGLLEHPRKSSLSFKTWGSSRMASSQRGPSGGSAPKGLSPWTTRRNRPIHRFGMIPDSYDRIVLSPQFGGQFLQSTPGSPLANPHISPFQIFVMNLRPMSCSWLPYSSRSGIQKWSGPSARPPQRDSFLVAATTVNPGASTVRTINPSPEVPAPPRHSPPPTPWPPRRRRPSSPPRARLP